MKKVLLAVGISSLLVLHLGCRGADVRSEDNVESILTYATLLARTIPSETSTSGVIADVAALYASGGDCAKAMEVAKLVEHKGIKASLLAKVAVQYARQNDTMKMSQVLSEAFGLVPSGSSESSVLLTMTEELARGGLYTEAQRAAELISDPDRKTAALIAMFRRCLANENKAEALNILARAAPTALTISNSDDRGTRLREISGAYLEAAELESALRVAKGIEDDYHEELALDQVSQAFATAGLYDKAVEIAKIQDRYHSNITLVHIAATYARANESGKAQALLAQVYRSVNGRNDSAITLAEIAVTYAEAGRSDRASELMDRAAEMVQEDADSSAVAWASAQIAVMYSRIGLCDRALEVANRAAGFYRVDALGQIAAQCVRSKQYDKLPQLIKAIEATSEEQVVHLRARQLVLVAHQYREQGEYDNAGKLLVLAAQLAKELPEEDRDGNKASALKLVAVECAAAGLYDLSLSVVEEIHDPYYKATALVQVCTRYRNTNGPIDDASLRTVREGIARLKKQVEGHQR